MLLKECGKDKLIYRSM